jgi:ribosomal-protein-alanine N-acetyltransferase
MDYMINDLINHNVLEVSLEVKKDNTKAINLYKKYGFVEVGVRRGYYQGIDGILMKKELM